MPDMTEGSVTMSLIEYDAMREQLDQDQNPMTRQDRIDSTIHAYAVVAGIGAVFVASAGAYYWIKDRYEKRQFERTPSLAFVPRPEDTKQ